MDSQWILLMNNYYQVHLIKSHFYSIHPALPSSCCFNDTPPPPPPYPYITHSACYYLNVKKHKLRTCSSTILPSVLISRNYTNLPYPNPALPQSCPTPTLPYPTPPYPTLPYLPTLEP